MPRLAPAEGLVLERILDDTFPLWNDGLTRERYGAYNRAQLATVWGRQRLQRLALVEGNHVLASAKRYDLGLCIDGVIVRTLGIGAVFTPDAERRRGHARELLERMLDAAAADGAGVALLFSEIAPAYYERLGFRAVPIVDAEITVSTKPGAPAVPIRCVEPADLPYLVDLHHEMANGHRLALRWDSDWLAYSLAKKRMLAAFAPGSGRSVECFVVEEGGRAVAWVLLQVRQDRQGYRDQWSLEACGDRDPTGARIGAILQALIARAPAAAPPGIRGWWPPLLQPPQLSIHPRAHTPITMMIRPLSSAAADLSFAARDVLYWHSDAF